MNRKSGRTVCRMTAPFPTADYRYWYIRRTALLPADPVAGAGGPLMHVWE
jgi:hypothetical protein